MPVYLGPEPNSLYWKLLDGSYPVPTVPKVHDTYLPNELVVSKPEYVLDEDEYPEYLTHNYPDFKLEEEYDEDLEYEEVEYSESEEDELDPEPEIGYDTDDYQY